MPGAQLGNSVSFSQAERGAMGGDLGPLEGGGRSKAQSGSTWPLATPRISRMLRGGQEECPSLGWTPPTQAKARHDGGG